MGSKEAAAEAEEEDEDEDAAVVVNTNRIPPSTAKHPRAAIWSPIIRQANQTRKLRVVEAEEVAEEHLEEVDESKKAAEAEAEADEEAEVDLRPSPTTSKCPLGGRPA